ncbi:MAG TPA: hypothetical protein PLI43_07900 [Albidovulum sp.]|uniref:hypothetical protein n=1 Tax=Albidovulum sp. TaxID=1872424 RepID=UPI002BAC7C2C|nr:hypothetical protein [Albidovulum sp.]
MCTEDGFVTDQLVAHYEEIIRNGQTTVVGNAGVAVTAFFQMERTDAGRGLKGPAEAKLTQAAGEANACFVNATQMAEALCGVTIAVNLMLVGYAAQKGLLPVSPEAIDDAIILNGTAVEFNRRAFLLGRVLAHASDRLALYLAAPKPDVPDTLDAIVADGDRRQRLRQGGRGQRCEADDLQG